MNHFTAWLVLATSILAASSSAVAAGLQVGRGSRPSAVKRSTPSRLPCGDLLSFQVLLDRQGFSPGAIDGRFGPNFKHALAAVQSDNGLRVTGQADCDTWYTLGGDSGDATVTKYTVTASDVREPFAARIPEDLVAQSKLSALGYQSALEKLAERFHASPELLKQLNRGIPLAADRTIRVPAVTPFDPDRKPPSSPHSGIVKLQVSRADSALRVTSERRVILFAPASTGSVHDPLPLGDWKVTGVDWFPAFNYNPDLFWDAKPEHTKAVIKPGPNNPVGVVWIALDLQHYGIHGTPEPSQVGHTQSHGCVRLTNWDAARVASLVKPGTPVLFQ
jgi:lipoprotein-anchoring transpeptidase ErfK/SrfK